LPLTEFSKLKRTGSYAQIFPGGDASGLRRVHEAYISDINHAVRRDTWPDDIAWHVFTSGDPYKTGCYLYLWRDDSGEPRSYIKFQHGRNQEKKKNEITVQELAFTGRESLYAALALTGSLTDMISDMVWEMPMFIDPADFVGDAWEVEQQIIPRDMTRIVNLRAALEQMRRPAGEGSYVIETEDQIIPENSGRWLVEYGPGTGRSRVARTQRDADLACDLPALAQLVTGYRTLASLLLSSRSRVELPRMGGADKLRGVFTLRPQHLTEYF